MCNLHFISNKQLKTQIKKRQCNTQVAKSKVKCDSKQIMNSKSKASRLFTKNHKVQQSFEMC